MEQFFDNLYSKVHKNLANKNEIILYKKLVKAIKNLSVNPFYPSLRSHEITSLTRRYGMKVFESYIENNVSSAKRIFWVYAPYKNDITIIGIEPHPNDKNDYKRIILSEIKI